MNPAHLLNLVRQCSALGPQPEPPPSPVAPGDRVRLPSGEPGVAWQVRGPAVLVLQPTGPERQWGLEEPPIGPATPGTRAVWVPAGELDLA